MKPRESFPEGDDELTTPEGEDEIHVLPFSGETLSPSGVKRTMSAMCAVKPGELE